MPEVTKDRMKILVTGAGTSGSWQIRGCQLGKAIGATVMPKAREIVGYDVVVLVKRSPPDLVQRVAGACVVWDIVDAWPQPTGNEWGRDECMTWLKWQIHTMRPNGIVAATPVMAEDLKEFGIPVLCLPHHSRPGLEKNPVRETVKVVGYEGSESYIAGWRPHIEAECAKRGWRFVVNQLQLADMDIVLALRDATGYAPRNWKSNVKLANAQASGTPFIGCREAGYMAQAVGNAERWADTPAELSAAFTALTPWAERLRASNLMMTVAPSLKSAAATYKNWLTGLCKQSS